MELPAQRFAVARLEFETLARGWNISDDALNGIFSFLEPLREYHTPTAAHCLRVGALAGKISASNGRPPYLGALGGALHDVGKIGCPAVLLSAFTISPEDYARIKPHVIIGYEMLMERFPEAAECMKHHHRFQPDPYPDPLPTSRFVPYPRRAALYELIGRDIAIADFVDSIKTRNNDKFGGAPLSTEEKYTRLLERHTDVREEIERLIREEIVRF